MKIVHTVKTNTLIQGSRPAGGMLVRTPGSAALRASLTFGTSLRGRPYGASCPEWPEMSIPPISPLTPRLFGAARSRKQAYPRLTERIFSLKFSLLMAKQNDDARLLKGCRVAGYGTITRRERVTSAQGCLERVPYPATRCPHHLQLLNTTLLEFTVKP